MRERNGHLNWWPGETPFEVCVGAILTQNTAWRNVEKAIANLRAAEALAPEPLYALPEQRLSELIRPAGYFNVKARRLRSFLRLLVEEYGCDLAKLMRGDTSAVRARLLAVNGIGPETADCMLLYAADHLSFVIDAYTKRIFARHGWCEPEADYHQLQAVCAAALSEKPLPERQDYWRDYHAQLVMVGKDFCRKNGAACERCPLRALHPPNWCPAPTRE